MTRRAHRITVVALLTACTLSTVGTSAHAAATGSGPHLAARVAPVTQAQISVTFTGTTASRMRRPMVLQRRAGRSWTALGAPRQTKQTGAFTFVQTGAISTFDGASFRVVAQRFTQSGRRYPAVTTPAVRVRVPAVPAVTDVVVTPVDRGLRVHWKRIPHSRFDYVTYTAPSPTGPWTRRDSTTASSTTLTELRNHVPLWVSVQPLGGSKRAVSVAATAPGVTGRFLAVYAVASDGVEDPNHPAAIANTVNAVNGWFATQTLGNVQPRWKREADGAVSVHTVRLTSTSAKLQAITSSSELLDEVDGMVSRLLPFDNGRYVVFLDNPTSVNDACGIASDTSALIIEQSCNIVPSASLGWPYGASYLAAHEMTHVFGADHVTNDNRDIVYSGSGGRSWDDLALDPGRDDYYGSCGGRSECIDISDSSWWTLTADPLS